MDWVSSVASQVSEGKHELEERVLKSAGYAEAYGTKWDRSKSDEGVDAAVKSVIFRKSLGKFPDDQEKASTVPIFKKEIHKRATRQFDKCSQYPSWESYRPSPLWSHAQTDKSQEGYEKQHVFNLRQITPSGFQHDKL